MTGIADAVRHLRHEKGLMTPEQITEKIMASRLGIPIDISIHMDEYGNWVRPSDYPDLDSITIADDFDGVYLTYDLRKNSGFDSWIGVYCTLSSGSYDVQRGHLSGGAFVVDETYTHTSDQIARYTLDPTNGNVQLWRVVSTGHITRFAFTTNTTGNSTSLANNVQPCVERVGQLLYLTDMSSSIGTNATTSLCYGTQWMERDAVVVKGAVSSLGYTWQQCYSLQSLDLSGWDTQNWTVTTLGYTWYQCYSLQSLDLSGWDTQNWTVTDRKSVV